MIGKWKGVYSYNVSASFEHLNLNPVEFNLEVNTLNENSFAGIVSDNVEMGGTDGIGTINGQIKNDSITFEKHMPIASFIDSEGNRTQDTKRKHPILVYEGTFDYSKMEINGTWKFKKKWILLAGFFPLRIRTIDGKFKMNKID